MRSPLLAALLLLCLLTAAPAPGAAKALMSLEARRLAQSLAGWDWLQDEAAAVRGRGPGAGGGGPPAFPDPGAPPDDADDSAEQRSWEVLPVGSKRALSVLSRFTPFTSMGTRRMGRYPSRQRTASMRGDYLSAETRSDLSDRPSGQPLRWGR